MPSDTSAPILPEQAALLGSVSCLPVQNQGPIMFCTSVKHTHLLCTPLASYLPRGQKRMPEKSTTHPLYAHGYDTKNRHGCTPTTLCSSEDNGQGGSQHMQYVARTRYASTYLP